MTLRRDGTMAPAGGRSRVARTALVVAPILLLAGCDDGTTARDESPAATAATIPPQEIHTRFVAGDEVSTGIRIGADGRVWALLVDGQPQVGGGGCWGTVDLGPVEEIEPGMSELIGPVAERMRDEVRPSVCLRAVISATRQSDGFRLLDYEIQGVR